MNDPFTPEGVMMLLGDKILKGDTKVPQAGDPAIANLSRALRSLRQRFEGWRGPWRVELENFRKVQEAIDVLCEILPVHRKAYAKAVAKFESFGTQGWAKVVARTQLSAFDALVKAARAARDAEIPLIQEPALVSTPRTEKWRDFGRELEAHFNHALPGRPKDALYRFIAEVTPAITGERPSFQAVKTDFKKKRLPEPKFEFGPEGRARSEKKIVKRGKLSARSP